MALHLQMNQPAMVSATVAGTTRKEYDDNRTKRKVARSPHRLLAIAYIYNWVVHSGARKTTQRTNSTSPITTKGGSVMRPQPSDDAVTYEVEVTVKFMFELQAEDDMQAEDLASYEWEEHLYRGSIEKIRVEMMEEEEEE